MGIRDEIEAKKQWRAGGKKQLRARLAQVKALPPDYQIVYKEIQKYFHKVGLIHLPDRAGLVDFFEEGVAAGKGVLELIGNDVGSFCDNLAKDSRTCAEIYQESISEEPGTAEQ